MMEVYKVFQQDLESLKNFHVLITDEVSEYNKIFHDVETTNFSRRSFCRTIFGAIEAYINLLKSSALIFTMNSPNLFTEEERLMLKDLQPFVNQKGEVELKSAKITLKDNVLLAFKAYAKAIGKTSEINFGSKGGATFIEAVKIRDKIMHPKSSADWEINDSDYDILREAWLWFTKSLCESGKIAEAF